MVYVRTTPACYKSAKLKSSQGFTFDNEKDFLIISTLSDLQPGKQTKVTIEFKGQMDNKIVGLYSSSYLNEETKERMWVSWEKFVV